MTPAGAPDTRRVFFALWPDEPQRRALEHAAAKAVRHCGGRPVPAANLHVTLAFLGSVPVGRIAELQGIARNLAAAFDAHIPIELAFERLVHWREPEILCALSAATESAGGMLAAALQEATATLGFTPDRRPFQAHVTLARKVVRVERLPRLRAVVWRFDAYALIDSRTAASGAIYSVIESYPLFAADKTHD